MPGSEHRALAKARLNRWFDSVEAHGLAEWNSAAYYPIDFIGLLALEHLGQGAIRGRAAGMLDRLFEMIALHTTGGVSAGSMGRAYDKELRAGPLTELAPFASVAFGCGWLNNGVAALPMFCAGGYSPPKHLKLLAEPENGRRIEARYVQGYGDHGQLALAKTAHVQLSACVDGVPGQGGHQQHLVDVQFAADPFARVWVNHPGQDDPWGQARPSFWAGNGVMPRVGMHGDCAMMMFDASGAMGAVPFTHAYSPIERFDEIREGHDWLILGCGGGAVALKATGEISRVTCGPGTGLEHRLAGARSGWAVAIADLTADGIDAFEAEVAHWQLNYLGEDQLHLSRPGRADLCLNYGTGLIRDGEGVPFPTKSRAPQISTSLQNFDEEDRT